MLQHVAPDRKALELHPESRTLEYLIGSLHFRIAVDQVPQDHSQNDLSRSQLKDASEAAARIVRHRTLMVEA